MPSQHELLSMHNKGSIALSSNDYASQLVEYRRQSPALQTIAGKGFSHLGWNHDSNDSSLSTKMPDQTVVKNYIVKNLKTLCQAKTPQVSPFHDIKAINVPSIPLIIDIGRCLGLKFVSAQEMHQESDSLVRSGVYIKKDNIQAGPVDAIADLLSKVEKNKPQADCAQDEKKECYSEYSKKRFRECEGGESICLGGRWYSRRDPMILMNCNIND